MLPLGTHATAHPEVTYRETITLQTVRLDDVVEDEWPHDWPTPNMLNMDLQGYEMHCLLGAPHVLDAMDVIYTEVNVDSLYDGCVLLPDLTAFLDDLGFELLDMRLAGATSRSGPGRWLGWGDAIFVRRGVNR